MDIILEKHFGVPIGGFFTIIGIIIGSGPTYLANRLQFKFQNQIEMNKWKRDKTTSLITELMTEIQQWNLNLLKSGEFSHWSNKFHKSLIPLIMIYMGYKIGANIIDEYIKLLKLFNLYQ